MPNRRKVMCKAKFDKLSYLRSLPFADANKELKRMNNSWVQGSRKVIQGLVKSQLQGIASPPLRCSTVINSTL